MSHKTVSILSILFALIGCSGGENTGSTSAPIPIYNQSYQENYAADTIDEILIHAKNAYVLIDPFTEGSTEYIPQIKAGNNQIAGYISVGTGEDWRDDFAQLEPYLSNKEWREWPGEYYVSQTTTGILDVMKRRIDKMAGWGIQWVEFDNMDWYDEEIKQQYALELSESQATNYINALCDYTHQKGMKCMAKNTVKGFGAFDGVLYESYTNEKNWWDRTGTREFLEAGKLVIINHYKESNCDKVYTEYKTAYQTQQLSFICEDTQTKKYIHYNQ